MKMSSRHAIAHTPDVRQAGFTIIELMIATMVFSVVLLIITAGVINFTHSYYRGINASSTQNTAQQAADAIVQAIQFSNSGTTATDGTEGYFCAGTKLFIYRLGFINSSTSAGLYEKDNTSASCPAGQPLTNGRELLSPNMRLTNIKLVQVTATNPTGGPTWQVSLEVALGDADLLCNSSQNGSLHGCNSTDTTYAAGDQVKGGDVLCRIQSGSQFCSVANLSTTAQQRIVN